MGFKYFDRVKDTTTTIGTGNVTVSGSAPTGFRTLSSVLDIGDSFPYVLISGNNWETGVGIYNGSNIFSRDVNCSSSTGSQISLNGTSDVMLSVISASMENSVHGQILAKINRLNQI